MMDYKSGDRVLVNVSAGIVPGSAGAPDWEPGTVLDRLDNGFYRVRLDEEIGGREAIKEAAPEHIRRRA
jgi:hypothetical protein